jgi:hypothetical protein
MEQAGGGRIEDVELPLKRLSVQILPQRRVDKRLITGRAPGLFRHSKEAIHNVLIQSNRDSGFAFGFGFRRKHPASLPFAEIVSILHGCASYS